MDKTQEEKFEKWNDLVLGQPDSDYMMKRKAWQACLEANGIGEECLNHAEPDPDHPGLFRAAIREYPSIPKGYFKIGEEVEAKIGGEYIKCLIVARDINSPRNNSDACDVRRIPAWKPQDGEAVLVGLTDPKDSDVIRAEAGVYSKGYIHGLRDVCDYEPDFTKRFDASKIGKPWSEI